jgi:hypothetical protein
MIVIGSNKAILVGKCKITRRHQWLGWLATLVTLSPIDAMVIA